ncbi:hypothetical protein CDL12_15317 [Handroanthus impetiginosus]|uniref:F-box domain-containing protein n=1 Tax=Handroanthus impetiginosus TaxID=429701 RepID=A0A2G9H451_9LAMI|nr:hypothetical protein CDL12_15317 [Handroanthus impetiginosus]
MAEGNSKRPLTGMVNNLTGGAIPLPNLPEEIITEILLRLPVKALLKFRCVSKSWLSLISSPQFIKTHLKISTKNNIYSHNRLIFSSCPRSNVFHTFSLNPKIDEYSSVDTLLFDYPLSVDRDKPIRIVGSCNGLVCVVVGLGDVVLWNPSTGKMKKLPNSGRLGGTHYGFGYDESNDDYKVVQTCWINHDPDAYETPVEVYSLRTDSWRFVNWPGGYIFDGPGVFVNGAIHWRVNYDDNTRNWVVIAQNIMTETCSNLELPMPVNDDDDPDVMLGICGGCLVMLGVCGGCLCAYYDHSRFMDIWMMKEYGMKDSWSKIVCFPYFSMKHQVHRRPKVLLVSENGGSLVNLGSLLIMYKPPQYHEILRLGYNVEVEAATYSESLISPDFNHFAGAS